MHNYTYELDRRTEHGARLQAALRRMISDRHYNHWVTFNFNTDLHQAAAQAKLRLWALRVIGRLFRNEGFVATPLAALFHFIAFPEFTAGHRLHFHACLFVHPLRQQWFAQCAARLWRRVAPAGTADIQVIGPTQHDIDQVINYGTKDANRPYSYENFVTSNMLELPEWTEAPTKHPSEPTIRCTGSSSTR